MIVLKVQYPKINYDTVVFHWKSNKEVYLLNKNNFFIKYDGINIEDLPLEVFWYSFLALMIPLLNMLEEETHIEFPEAIPSYIVETWINHQNSKNFTVSPLSIKKSNHINDFVSNTISYDAAVLFGGGKDSTYAYSVLSEILGINKVLLVSYVHSWSQRAMSMVNVRRDNFILKPLKNDLDAKIQKIICDFSATVKGWDAIHSIGVTLYTGTILPIILKYNIPLLTHTNEFIVYRTGIYGEEDIDFTNLKSRPEYDNYLSDRTNAYFGSKMSIKNLSYYLSGLAAYKIIAERYPYMLDHLTMCETIGDPNIKWCKDCLKCSVFALYSLYYGYDQKDIDLDYFFCKGKYINNLIKNTNKFQPLEDESGNYPWHQSISKRGHFEPLCHVFASINPEVVRKKTSEQGFNNFMVVRSRYGNKKYPAVEGIIEPAFEKLSPLYGEEIKRIISKHCNIIKEVPKYFIWGNSKVVIDYNLECRVPAIFKL